MTWRPGAETYYSFDSCMWLACVHLVKFIACGLQIQEQLETLAKRAVTDVMSVVKGEKHVFTNDSGYMELLNRMRAHVLREQQSDARDQTVARILSGVRKQDAVSCLLLLSKGL